MPYVITTDAGDGSCTVHCMVESVEDAKFLINYIEDNQSQWDYECLLPDFHPTELMSREEAIREIHDNYGVEE